ncbi:hypothetical protein [Streptomyces sp. NPDC001137]|uniref:hypothetical protein n=1 Tax=Streptomyces sp. NPDC001137 TaxID=3154378 RepID=UPI003319EC55
MRTMMLRTRAAAVTVTGLVVLTLGATTTDHITRHAQADDRGPGIVPTTIVAEGRGPGILTRTVMAQGRGPGVVVVAVPADDRGPGNAGV